MGKITSILIIVIIVSFTVIIVNYFDSNKQEPNSMNDKSIIDDARDIINSMSKLRYPLNVFVEPVPVYANKDIIESINEAIAYWNIERGKEVFKVVDIEKDLDVRISWIKEIGSEKVGTANGFGFVHIGLGDSNCYDRWNEFTHGSITQIAKHELGHILGYKHSNDTNDIMYPISYTYSHRTDIDKAELLPADFVIAFPFCNYKEISRYDINIQSEERIDVYLLPSNKEYDKLVDAKDFIYDERCNSKRTKSFQKICDVTNESIIAIVNQRNYPVTFDIKLSEVQ